MAAAAQKGVLIAVEGIDGTGKSTQVALLAERLRRAGLAVVATREPTDGRWGRQIRRLFHDRAAFGPEEELRLFIEDRREHVKELIAPALAAGQVVITDRYYYSTAAYQGALGKIDPAAILAMNEEFAPRPDLVLLLTAAPAVGVGRVRDLRRERLNDFEQEESLARVAAIFAGFADPSVVRIDATGDTEAVHQALWPPVAGLLRAKGLLVGGEGEGGKG